ncbi:MAG TPA: hypothetical protein VFG09_09560 [Thermodesulfovibrionales bacterium]|nr:hypothetical protein [Thermodesulfovibrionales bacterium]
MGTIDVIKKFIESTSVIEMAVREVLERLPLRFRYGISYGPTFRYWLGFLKESEKWDRERLEAYQVEQMRNLLIHAGRNVPYYRKVFNEYGFRPEGVQCLDDISVLPYIDRATVKENYNEFMAENIPRTGLIPTATSGTTGIPLAIYGTKETEEKHWATIIDLWSRIGYHPASRAIFFEANIREGKKVGLPYKKYGNKMILSSNYFIDEWIDRFAEMMNKFRPEYLIGFPHTLATFSSYMKNKRKSLGFGLKGAIVYAENVYDWQREMIRDVFGVGVFGDYGMVEKVIHGGGCEHSAVSHLYPQYGITERAHLHDSKHELVGTGFVNYAMPLVRYRTGDVCEDMKKACPKCGRNFDIAYNLTGRMGDFLIDAEGRIISIYLNLDFKIFEGIRKFQLFQEIPGEVEMRIWPDVLFKNEDADRLINEIRKCTDPLGRGVRFRTEAIEDRDLRSSAKYRMIDQRLDIRIFLA